MGLLTIKQSLAFYCCLATLIVSGQEDFRYKRSSLYSVSVIDPTEQFCSDFAKLFENLPLSDKYNDHSIGLRTFRIKSIARPERLGAIDNFLEKNQIAKRLIAKWFDRDRTTGCFDMEFVAERGQYNASQLDAEIARSSALGYALLSDAGEQLIENTFVVLYYFDYQKQLKSAEELLAAASGTIDAVSDQLGKLSKEAQEKGYSNDILQNFFDNLEKMTPDFTASFQVNVTCYLFQLKWDEATAVTFYNNFWCDRTTPEDTVKLRKIHFDNEKELFRLEYLGQSTALSERVSTQGCRNNREILNKLFARVMDRNLVELQRKYEVFKVKVPLYNADKSTVTARVGLKEGISAASQFEVLETEQDDNGKIRYVRKGIIEPIPGSIWDNRFMAAEEQANNANLGFTTFRVIEGKKFYPGMLIREIRFTPR